MDHRCCRCPGGCPASRTVKPTGVTYVRGSQGVIKPEHGTYREPRSADNARLLKHPKRKKERTLKSRHRCKYVNFMVARSICEKNKSADDVR